jgi:hypothetical protein
MRIELVQQQQALQELQLQLQEPRLSAQPQLVSSRVVVPTSQNFGRITQNGLIFNKTGLRNLGSWLVQTSVADP